MPLLISLSTDYVFDGRQGPYSEQDKPQPLSVYGRTKLESERIVLDAAVDGLVVRTLWLYGHLHAVRPNLVTWPLGALARGLLGGTTISTRSSSLRSVGSVFGTSQKPKLAALVPPTHPGANYL